jgi:hypothetical protein
MEVKHSRRFDSSAGHVMKIVRIIVFAPVRTLRDVPLRHRVAALVYGAISLFLFGVVFDLPRHADRIAPTPAWAWVLAALIALVAAVGALFGLVAWGALSDPKSRLGSWFRKRADDVHSSLWSVAFETVMWVGFYLVFRAGSYDTSLGLAVFLCWVLLLVQILRQALKSDSKAPNDPNDNPPANRLIGKSRERR